MVQDKQRPPRRGADQRWIYLGASGVLQPLSDEFLYRSPEDPATHASRWHRRPAAGGDHAAV